MAFCFLAGGEGFEPPLAESESAVLPLDDPPSSPAILLEGTLVWCELTLSNQINAGIPPTTASSPHPEYIAA